jgi:hypothetical protein
VYFFLAEIRSVRRRFKATTKKLDDKMDTLKAKVKGDGHDSDSEDEKDKKDKKDEAEDQKEKDKKKKDAEENKHAESTGANLHPSNAALDGAPDLFRTASAVSGVSNASKKSEESRSKFPVFDPAAPALPDLSDDSDEEEDDHDVHAFDHPSTYVDQAWIWLPRDQLGLSELLANDLKAAGVDASDVGASMDDRGIVEVTRNPPDEEWHGGHDK